MSGGTGFLPFRKDVFVPGRHPGGRLYSEQDFEFPEVPCQTSDVFFKITDGIGDPRKSHP